MTDRLQAIAEGFSKQAEWCHQLGSPFSGALMEQAAAALSAGDDFISPYMPWWEGKTAGDVATDVLPLRFLGCAHVLALGGNVAALSARYPSCGGDGNAEGVWALALDAFKANSAFTVEYVRQPPQTNEVGRAGALMAGLLELARLTDLPVSTFELGASAGLLQGMDRFHYRFGDVEWGDETSPCRISPEWMLDAVPPVGAPLKIVARRACDYAPIDVLDPGTALKIKSYIWTDMPERLARLDAAIAIAQDVKPVVEGVSADVWLEDVLGGSGAHGQVRCVLHSIMWQYMPADVQARAFAAIEAAGARATAQAPFAWLRFEPETNNKPVKLTLALWRGGACETRHIAGAHPHATQIGWVGWDNAKPCDSPALVQNFN